MRRNVFPVFLILLLLLTRSAVMAEGTVSLEPVRAPSKGSDNTPVTVIEIADFM